MQRVVVLGRGAAGKTTFARQLSRTTGLPVVELDEVFWSADLEPPGAPEWVRAQQALVADERWVLDGDLGPYDVVEVRLARADTVVVLDHGFVRCAVRALRRSREAADFWSWVWHYRRRSLPLLRDAIRTCAPAATVHHLTSPRQVRRLLEQVR